MSHRGYIISIQSINSDIDFIEDMTPGSNFSLLYENSEEFIDIAASFLDAGLRNNECCMWIISDQLDTSNAKELLKVAGIDVDKYIENGQLVLSSCNECNVAGEEAVSQRDIKKWEDLYNIAINKGYDGLRVVDKFTIVGEDAWESFVEYEKKAMDLIKVKSIVALFAFLLEARTRSEVLDIIGMHDGSIINQKDRWTLLQSSSSCKVVQKEAIFPGDILENVWTGVWVIDKHDNIVYWNMGMEFLSGMLEKDVIGTKIISFIPRKLEADELRFIDVFHMAKKSLHSRNYDIFPFVKPDGHYIYHSGVLFPLRDEHGEYAGMLGTIANTTEQTIDPKNLKSKFISIERQEDIYKNSPVVAFLWAAKRDWPIEFVSENIAQFGYLPEELTSGNITYGDMIHPDDLDLVRNDVEQVEISGKMYFSKDFRLLTKSGEVRCVTERSFLIRDEDGNPAYYQGIIIDITDRKKAEDAKIEAEKKYRMIFENSPLGIFNFDRNGVLSHCNRKFLQLMGVENREDIIGFDLLASIVNPKMRKAVNDVLSRKVGHFEGEYHTVLTDVTIYIKADYSPNIAEDGTFLGGIGVFEDISERKRAEEKLLKSEAFLSEVSRIAKIGGWELDASTGKGTWTPETARIHELDPSTPADIEFGLSFYSPGSKELIEKAVHDAVQKGEPYDLELELVTAKGTHKWVRTIGNPIIKDGKVVNVTGALQDITERKMAKEAALEAEKKYRLIFENSPLGIFHFNAKGILTHCNENFLQIIGLQNKEEIIGFDMVTQITDKMMKKAINDALSRKNGYFEGKYHTVISGKDVYLKADYSPNVADDGTFLGGIGIFGDISVRKKAEEALRLDESRLEALLKINQMTDASIKEIADFVQEEAVRLTRSQMGYIAFLNEEGTILIVYSWSKNMLKNCKVKEMKLEYPLESTGLWGEPIRQKKAIIINDYDAPNPLKRGYPEGHNKLSRYMSIPIFDGKKVVGAAGVTNKQEEYNKSDARQLTLFMEGIWRLIQRKRAEDTLREYADEISKVNAELSKANAELSKANAELSDANEELKSLDRMKDDFLSNVSHEFKTPLTSIQGYSQLIADQTLGSVNAQQKKALDTVIRNSERLRRLVDSLLYLSRAGSGRLIYSFEKINMADVITNSIQDLALQAEEKNIKLIKEIPDTLPLITADHDKMMDVFVNLVDNAIKFTPQDGKITISAHASADSLHFEVEDTGIGIPKDKIPGLFERFYQVDSSARRKYGGTGLGLYICKKIVEDHGGNIWAESTEGEGSRFHIKLPL
ncbi:MAG: PAS domain S-box protein [Methanolobus sp.]|nr:PAS domain S-box protein [Methanolobus sp.]